MCDSVTISLMLRGHPESLRKLTMGFVPQPGDLISEGKKVFLVQGRSWDVLGNKILVLVDDISDDETSSTPSGQRYSEMPKRKFKWSRN